MAIKLIVTRVINPTIQLNIIFEEKKTLCDIRPSYHAYTVGEEIPDATIILSTNTNV